MDNVQTRWNSSNDAASYEREKRHDTEIVDGTKGNEVDCNDSRCTLYLKFPSQAKFPMQFLVEPRTRTAERQAENLAIFYQPPFIGHRGSITRDSLEQSQSRARFTLDCERKRIVVYPYTFRTFKFIVIYGSLSRYNVPIEISIRR